VRSSIRLTVAVVLPTLFVLRLSVALRSVKAHLPAAPQGFYSGRPTRQSGTNLKRFMTRREAGRNCPSTMLAAWPGRFTRPYRPQKTGGLTVDNDQQREGKLEQARGTVKEHVGDATGNEQMEHEGKVDQGKGNIREGVGDVEKEWDDATKR